MEPDLSQLDDYLADNGLDGYLVDADGEDSDQRYLSGFTAPDPFVTLYTGETNLLVSSLEFGRAKRESRADTVERGADYDIRREIEEYGLPEASYRVLSKFLKAHNAERVAAPSQFPLGTADGIRDHGIAVTCDEGGIVEQIRAIKLPEEIDHIRRAQRANETSMRVAERMIRDADIDGDGTLFLDSDTLTSERIKQEIEITLLRRGFALDTTIVSCGEDAADPHERGSGPLKADEPIIVDIFPRSKETGYFADMTRTFVVGEPTETIREWYDLTREAKQAALDALGPGVSGSEVHGAACDVYENAGWPTLRDDPSTETGFIHTTGHGVGLDIHEYPRISSEQNELKPGHVVTIEPGLYNPQFGGVRIEDIVVVTDEGYENFTDYDESLVV